KSGKISYGSPWHQDWVYWHGAHKISVWIAIDDATPENGCLKMIPGSHRMELSHDGTGTSGSGANNFPKHLRPDAIDERAAKIMSARSGTAIIFHDLCLHASLPNKSGKDRFAVISTYRNGSEADYE